MSPRPGAAQSMAGMLAKPKTTSPAKVQSNRDNARRSTGPRTAEGKARSARNSVKHGFYAAKLAAITVGPYAEDPDEIATFVQAAIETLAPRDFLEAQVARQIAALFLRQRRLLEWEGGLLNAAVPVDDYERVMALEESQVSTLRAVVEWSRRRAGGEAASATGSSPAFPWREMGTFVYARLANQKTMTGAAGWRIGVEEATAEQWEAQFVALIEEHFPKQRDLDAWLELISAAVSREVAQMESAALGQIADESVAVVERNAVTQARITNELAKQFAFYDFLKSRVIEEG